MRAYRLVVLFSYLVTVLSSGVSPAQTVDPVEEMAYEYNRAGMAKMSMARFDEAIEEFRKAEALMGDYQIRNRPLVYTPIFMTGWAYEKLGRRDEACAYFRRFLETAPPEVREESKAEHARAVLGQCKN